MKYLLLVYGDEQLIAAMSSSERDILQNACLSNNEALRTSGRLVAVESIQHSSAIATVRFENGHVALTDVQLADTKEQLIGIFTVYAKDLNEAIQVASTMPQVRGGAIQVRPILENSDSSKLC